MNVNFEQHQKNQTFLSNLIIFLFLCTGMIFTDLPIHGKTVTRSTMIFITSFILPFILILNNFKIKPLTKNLRSFILYTISTFIISLFTLFFSVISKQIFYFYDKNLLIKHFEAFISLSLIHFFVYFLLIYNLSKLNLNLVKKVVYSFFVLLTIAAFIEHISPEKLNTFHSNLKNYERLRLFSSEPSHAVLVYLIFSSITLFCVNNIFIRVVTLFFSFTVFILIASKGAFIALILTLAISFLYTLRNLKYISVILIMLTVILYIFISYIIPDLLTDIEKFTSFSTRLSGLISAFLILFTYPFGLGYGSYIALYPNILYQSYEIANDLFFSLFNIQLSDAEISNIITTGKNLGVKSGIPQSIMVSGWLGLIFWLIIFKNTISYIKVLRISKYQKFVLKTATLFTFIQLIIGSEYTLLYVIWLLIAFIEVVYYKQNRKVSYNDT